MKGIVTKEEHGALKPDVQAEYTAREDGRFYVKIDPVDGFEFQNISGLRSSLDKEKANFAAASLQLSEFSGLSPARAREAIEKMNQMSTWSPEKKVQEQIASVQAAMTEAHSVEIKPLKDKLGKLRGQLEREVLHSAAVAACVKHEADVDLILPHVLSAIRVEELPDGTIAPRVYNDQGTVRYSMREGQSGLPMPIEELVGTMKTQTKYKPLFKGLGQAGSGAMTPGRAGSSNGNFVLTSEEARDPVKYRKTRDAAEKAGSQVEVRD